MYCGGGVWLELHKQANIRSFSQRVQCLSRSIFSEGGH